jgi:hypothetical protein
LYLHVTHGKSNSYIKSNCGSSPCVNAGVSATKKCLDEIPDYYTRLVKMEKEAENKIEEIISRFMLS